MKEMYVDSIIKKNVPNSNNMFVLYGLLHSRLYAVLKK
jgi:hypothetical protein